MLKKLLHYLLFNTICDYTHKATHYSAGEKCDEFVCKGCGHTKDYYSFWDGEED